MSSQHNGHEDMEQCEAGLIILAAGESRRFGTPKQLCEFDGETLLRRMAREATGSLCSPVVVVLGRDHDRLLQELNGTDVWVALNTHWQSGIGSSIKCGLRTLLEIRPAVQAAVLCVSDQPYVTAGVIDDLVYRFRRTQ